MKPETQRNIDNARMSYEVIKERIRAQILEAIDSARSVGEVEVIRRSNQANLRKFLEGERYEEEPEPGVVKLKGITEFQCALRLLTEEIIQTSDGRSVRLLDEEEAVEILRHETLHMDEALNHFPAKLLSYTLQFMKGDSGISYYPGVGIDFSTLSLEELSQYREGLRKTINRPDDLSSTDKAQLGV